MVHFSLIRPLEGIFGVSTAWRLEDVADDFRDDLAFLFVFRQVIEDEGLSWPEIWDESRRRGLMRSIPNFTRLAIQIAGWFCGILTLKAFYALAHVVPLSKYRKNRKERKNREREFRHIFIKTPAPQPFSLRVSTWPSTPSPKPCGFFRLPPEIRNEILIYAFGQRTLHMSLEYQHPFYIANERRQGYPTHAGIEKLAGFRNSHLRTDVPKKWMWFGCVCHRFRPATDGNVPLPLGRIGFGTGGLLPRIMVSGRNEELWRGDLDLASDICLEGFGYCNKWGGSWPGKCHIGIMGWLLTCRQAYLEGINVLYRTNTIQMASVELHRSLPDILSPILLSSLTSLELIWDLAELLFDDGFISKKSSDTMPQLTPLFPSMSYLRFAFAEDMTRRRYQVLGMRWNSLSEDGLAAALNDRILPMLDRLVQRIVPASTDVTFSCLDWNWYTTIDLRLIDLQGVIQSKPQLADIGGLKIWRLTPKPEPGYPEENQEELLRQTGREGIWIHVAPRELPHGLAEEPSRRHLYDFQFMVP